MLVLVFHVIILHMLIGSEKPLWGEFNKLLYCIVSALYTSPYIMMYNLVNKIFCNVAGAYNAHNN